MHRRWVLERRRVPSKVSELFARFMNSYVEPTWEFIGSDVYRKDAKAAQRELSDLTPAGGWFRSGAEFRVRRIDT